MPEPTNDEEYSRDREVSHDEDVIRAAEILGHYKADWSPEDVKKALSDLTGVTVYVSDWCATCPACEEADNLREIREHTFECGACGAVWTE